MMMGAGKTTCVSPLLNLSLADGERLLVNVVPSALLPMSLAVLRARLAGPGAGAAAGAGGRPRPVCTLAFDRTAR